MTNPNTADLNGRVDRLESAISELADTLVVLAAEVALLDLTADQDD